MIRAKWRNSYIGIRPTV